MNPVITAQKMLLPRFLSQISSGVLRVIIALVVQLIRKDVTLVYINVTSETTPAFPVLPVSFVSGTRAFPRSVRLITSVPAAPLNRYFVLMELTPTTARPACTTRRSARLARRDDFVNAEKSPASVALGIFVTSVTQTLHRMARIRLLEKYVRTGFTAHRERQIKWRVLEDW